MRPRPGLNLQILGGTRGSRPPARTAPHARASAAAAWRSPGTWLGLLAVAAVAILARAANLDEPARFDELYHVLAAEGWLAEGRPVIAEGYYDRGWPFTLLVAWCFELFGESLAVARLPSVAAGVALVVAVYLWTRSVAGDVAALAAGLLLALYADAIEVSQFARFYALHGFLFWLGSIATYTLCVRPLPPVRAIALALGAAACLVTAWSLEWRLTLLGLIALALWPMLRFVSGVLIPWLRAAARSPQPRLLRPRWLLFVGVLALAVLASTAVATVLADRAAAALADLWEGYRSTSLWNAQYRNAFWFYHAQLSADYPTLWPLFPVAILVGLAYRPRVTGFCTCIFVLMFLILSFAGAKGNRLLYHIIPFFFVIWGITLQYTIGHLYLFLARVVDQGIGSIAPDGLRRPIRWGVVSAVLLFVVAANATFIKAAAMVSGVPVPPMTKPVRWDAARTALEPWLDSSAIVVTTSELEALYYLERYDILLSKSRVDELGSEAEFDTDDRTGRPVISTPESLQLIMRCFDSGLLVTPDTRWRNPAQLDDRVADLVSARMTPIELPKAHRIYAFRWQRSESTASPEECTRLPGFGGDETARSPRRG